MTTNPNMFDFSQTFQDEIHQPFTWQGDKDICAVLVHGFPGTPSEMRPIADILHAQGWSVQGILLPGFGIEINSITEKTYTDWLSAVLNSVNKQTQAYSRVVLVGLSMGGAISIQASTSTNIDGLLLLAPFWKVEHVLWTMLPAIKVVLPNFKPFSIFKPDWDDTDFRNTIGAWLPSANIDDPQVREEILQFVVPTGIMNQVRIAGNHARQSVSHITAPTTVIQGRQDELVKPELTQTLVQNMSTDVNYILLDGDHNLTDTQKPHWEKVKAHIQQYAIQFEVNNR